MKLHCYPHPNFGDAPLNRWLWPQLLPGLLQPESHRLFVGIGSLLNDMLPAEPLKVIFGSGVGYGQRPPAPDATYRFYAVRGPLSAQALGLAPELAITDSAMLVRAVALPPLSKRYRLSYMPHWWSDVHGHWRAACELAGIHFIDPLGGVETVLADLRETELLISEALHGTIVADALRTPWVPVSAYKHILSLKWEDWCQSVGLPYQPHRLAPLYHPDAVQARLRRLRGWAQTGPLGRLAERVLAQPAGWWYQRQVERNAQTLLQVAAQAAPQLTDDATLDRVTGRLLAALDTLKADYAAGRLILGRDQRPVTVLTA